LSDFDAYGDEMGRFSRLNDRELDRLLGGQGPAEDGDLDDLAAFVRELNVAFQEGPDGPTETRHLTAIMDSVRLQPTADTPPPMPRRTVWSGGTARVAFAGVLALGAFCGVAYAGALPGPVQGAVADVARNVGVSLPGAHNNKDDGAQNDNHDNVQTNAPTATQTDTNPGAETNGQGSQTKDQSQDGGQNQPREGNQNDSHGSQNGNSGAEPNTNAGVNSPDEGSQGNAGTTPQTGQGGTNQDNGGQGNGDN
jgi:hypothetical protein